MPPDPNILSPSHPWLLMASIGSAAFLLNLPLGYLREGARKFSPAWFLYVHLSIPVIAFLRIANHVSAWAIPPFIACALLGQVVGGRFRRIRRSKS